jgi:hypothetical protein
MLSRSGQQSLMYYSAGKNFCIGIIYLEGNFIYMCSSYSPSAVVVAHPGHEIRIHGWLGSMRPRVFILTDGSGRVGKSRLDFTTAYLAEMSLKHGSIYGRLTDSEIYTALLNHDFALFLRLADEMAESFALEGVETVAGDATEGYHPSHDVCRLLINTAVLMLKRDVDGVIRNLDFPVVNAPDVCPQELRDSALWLTLDENSFEQKIAAARKYYPELVAEMASALDGTGDGPVKNFLELREKADAAGVLRGLDMFRIECLRPVDQETRDDVWLRERPFYEPRGEREVAAGHFDRVIRYREHLRPLEDALREHVERSA